MMGPEMDPSWGRFAIASIIVIGLLSLLTFALKYLVGRGILNPVSTNKRLRFIASLPLDSKRRLVITRYDDKEYLILLGANNEQLISTSPISPSPVSPSDNQQNDT